MTVFVLPADAPGGTAERAARCARIFTGEERDWALARAPGGKPYFTHAPALGLSVSHSGAFWACALGGAELGLDVQEHRPCRREALARRFFHPEETDFLARGGYADFFSVWCAKESFVKFTGEGIRRDFSSFSVVARGALADAVGSAALRHIPLEAGYSLCACSGAAGPVSLRRVGKE